MSIFFNNFHFLRPWWLLALLAFPLLWRALAPRGTEAGAWRGAVDAHLLQYLLEPGDDAPASRWPRRLGTAAWVLACVALAGPAWERLPQPLLQNRAARVFALELSSSMFAQDAKPSRYERARYKLHDALARSGDAQTALIAYAGDAFVVAPLTDDANTVANLVDALDPSVMPVAGNDTVRAIDLGASLIKQAGVSDGEIVLFADSANDGALAAARRANAQGVRVSVLGIGSAQGAPVPLPQGGFLKDASGAIVLPKLDVAALSALAQAGGGRYENYTADAGDLDALLEPLVGAASARTTQATTPRFQDRGPWLLLLLLPLAALGFRRGWLMLVPLAVFAYSESAQAFSWTDLWQRADQQARAQLDAGNAAQARQLAQAPDLRGSAAYRAGDFADATQDFAQAQGADADYNRGNALAKQGRYQDAIAAYDSALKRAPDMADAAANKRAIEEWLKKQQQQDEQKQQNSQDHQGHGQQQDGKGSSSGEKSQDDDKQQGQDQQQSSAQSAKAGDAGQDQQQQGKPQQDAQRDNNGTPRDQKTQASSAQEPDQQAQQQFRQSMDRAMQKNGDGDKAQQPIRLGANESGQRDEKQQAVEQWLQHVPDDPGGLLRRKFQLEYQQRQQKQGGKGP